MTSYSTLNLEFDLIPLGAFWTTFSEEAPNRYQYQALLEKFYASSH